MGPVPGFCHFGLPDKKTALVLGLCYEAERAIGLAEYVEPAEIFAFYTDPALNRSFAKTVRKNNAQLLARLGEARIFKHPMTDLQTTANKRVPIPNGYELRQALEDRGVTVRMVVYKGFGHGIDKPKQQHEVMEENLKWFGKWIWGEP